MSTFYVLLCLYFFLVCFFLSFSLSFFGFELLKVAEICQQGFFKLNLNLKYRDLNTSATNAHSFLHSVVNLYLYIYLINELPDLSMHYLSFRTT